MPETRTLITTLVLPYENVRTVYEGDCEVRLYRNELTGELQVGKRFDTLGLEDTTAFQEGSLLRQINHPNICPVYDVAEVEGFPKPLHVIEIIMPYFHRGSLYDALNRGERFTIGQAVDLITGALYGVAELHEVRDLLHRDLKSPNLLLSDDNRLIVSDLGTASKMDNAGFTDSLPNARLYSPPESFTSCRLDRCSDLYQMGLVLHELTSGPLPYDSPAYSIDAIAQRLEKGRRPVMPRDLVAQPWVPRRLRTVINKATAADPTNRYRSAKLMGDAISAAPIVDWQPIRDEPDRKRWEGSTPQRRDRRFAVDATYVAPNRRRTEGRWVLSGLQEVNRWQRVLADTPVAGLSGRQATDFFDAMVDIAHNR